MFVSAGRQGHQGPILCREGQGRPALLQVKVGFTTWAVLGYTYNVVSLGNRSRSFSREEDGHKEVHPQAAGMYWHLLDSIGKDGIPNYAAIWLDADHCFAMPRLEEALQIVKAGSSICNIPTSDAVKACIVCHGCPIVGLSSNLNGNTFCCCGQGSLADKTTLASISTAHKLWEPVLAGKMVLPAHCLFHRLLHNT